MCPRKLLLFVVDHGNMIETNSRLPYFPNYCHQQPIMPGDHWWGIYHNIASMDMVEKLVWPKKNKELEVNSIVRIHFSLGSEIERANWDNKENRTSENQIVVSELDYYHTKRNNLVLRRMNLVVDQRKGARSVFSFYYFSVFFICCATLGFREARKVEWLGG